MQYMRIHFPKVAIPLLCSLTNENLIGRPHQHSCM